MGSLCKGTPAKTVTNSSNTSTTTPTGLNQLNDIWSRVSAAASTPYQAYGGQMVADLNPTQLAGIEGINNAAGSAMPYFDLAAQYGQQGAAAIDPNNIQRYISPYTQNVIDATRANFGETNAQQQQQVLGNAAIQGALGGDRVGVAQAELARQQKLAQDPVIAGMYDTAYTKALGAAQADRSAAAQGAYTFGSLAPAIQNSQISGAQAQIGAGSVAQNNQQQNLTAQYNQYLQAMAYPYQQAQFLASAGLPAVGAMGGTTSGNANSTQTQQQAQASPLSQIAGLGMAGLGLMSGNPMAMFSGASSLGSMFGGGGNPSSMAYGSNPFTPYGSVNPAYAAHGGRINMNRGGRAQRSNRFADGGFVDQVNAIRQALRGGGVVIDTMRNPNGIYVPRGYADGGEVTDPMYAPFPGIVSSFEDRFAPASPMVGAEPAEDSAFWNQYVAGKQTPMTAASAPAVPLPQARPSIAVSPFSLPPQITNPGGSAPAVELPQDAMAYDGALPPSGGLRAPMTAPAQAPAFMPGMEPQQPQGPFGLSEDARMGMIAAGLGMMASRNPNGLGAIGEGGLTGLKAYAENRSSRQRNELAARKLMQDAEQFAKGHELRKDTLGETKRYHDMTAEERAEARKQRAQDAKDRSEDRRDNLARTAYPGEGVDEDGKTVKGMYQFNPETRDYEFKPGKVIQKGAGSGPKPGAVEQLADRLVKDAKERGQELTFQEAVGLAKRAPNNQEQLKRETLALTAAKNDMGYLRDPVGTLEKWRKQYGLGAPGEAPGTKPAPDKPAAPTSQLKPTPPDVAAKAKEAIAKGAPREAVLKRLKDAGMDTSGI